MSDKLKSVMDSVPWARLLIEGGVIVFSILLAFAIDAWWDERQDREREVQQLARVSAELELNETSLTSKQTDLRRAFESAVVQQGWMGENPEPVAADEMTQIWNRILGIGTLSVPSRAINEYLAAASEGDPEFAEIRDQLTEWSYRAERLSNQYDLLRQKHAKLTDYLIGNDEIPVLSTLPAWMSDAGLPSSSFPHDPSSLLDDVRLENLLGDYMIRLLFVDNMLDQQLQRQAELIRVISEAIKT
ncbi:MAG: hypothetical protein AAGA33_11425 [Pseudomonadota bacterium]